MESPMPPADIQVHSMRPAKDDSVGVYFFGRPKEFLSQQQMTVLLQASADERGFVPICDLFPPVFQATGSPTPWQRASMSRLVARLYDRELATGRGYRIVKLADLGKAIAEWAVKDERWSGAPVDAETKAESDRSWARLAKR